MQRVFKHPRGDFSGIVTIDLNNGQYSNYTYHRAEGEPGCANVRQQAYTHGYLEHLITKYVGSGWWVEDIDPDLIVAEGL